MHVALIEIETLSQLKNNRQSIFPKIVRGISPAAAIHSSQDKQPALTLQTTMKLLLKLLFALSLLGFAGISRADDQAIKPYTLSTCVFSSEKLGEMGKIQTEVYKGQEMKFCCKDCKKKFDQDPEAGLKKYDDAVKKAAKSSSTMDPNMKM